MAGAKSRLLPLSIPFGFFVAAAVFHLAFWLLLALAAPDLPDFLGGPGTLLAALHLLTLGVLAMAAIGASLQLLPVATRSSVGAVWPGHLLLVLMIVGVLLLAWGMAMVDSASMLLGAGVVSAAFAIFFVLIAGNLMRTSEITPVLAYAWAAQASLAALAGLGIGLIVDFDVAIFWDHRTVTLLHALIASFGFMGLLVLGYSHILIPMFALAGPISDGKSLAILFLALAAIFLGCLALILASDGLLLFAFALGLVTALLYGRTMLDLLKRGMRKNLGVSLLLIRLSWALLPTSLVLGAGLVAGLWTQEHWTLFGFLVLVGWLLSFLLGVLQRILPFLASMHSATGGAAPILLSRLTPQRPLILHAGCHMAALLAVVAGLVAGQDWLIRAGALIGAMGALAFLIFVVEVLRRLLRHRAPSAG